MIQLVQKKFHMLSFVLSILCSFVDPFPCFDEKTLVPWCTVFESGLACISRLTRCVFSENCEMFNSIDHIESIISIWYMKLCTERGVAQQIMWNAAGETPTTVHTL